MTLEHKPAVLFCFFLVFLSVLVSDSRVCVSSSISISWCRCECGSLLSGWRHKWHRMAPLPVLQPPPRLGGRGGFCGRSWCRREFRVSAGGVQGKGSRRRGLPVFPAMTHPWQSFVIACMYRDTLGKTGRHLCGPFRHHFQSDVGDKYSRQCLDFSSRQNIHAYKDNYVSVETRYVPEPCKQHRSYQHPLRHNSGNRL